MVVKYWPSVWYGISTGFPPIQVSSRQVERNDQKRICVGG